MFNGFLKQSTASQSRNVGPFLDDTDFITPETGLTIANTDVKLSKGGAAGANKNSGGGTHRNNGMYSLTFDATDTDTVGELAGSILVSGAMLVVFKFMVVEETIYDAYYGASAAGIEANTLTTLSQGKPPANPTMQQALMHLYWRHIYGQVKVDTDTANQARVYADDGTTILYEWDISDSSNVFTRAEVQTGA